MEGEESKKALESSTFKIFSLFSLFAFFPSALSPFHPRDVSYLGELRGAFDDFDESGKDRVALGRYHLPVVAKLMIVHPLN